MSELTSIGQAQCLRYTVDIIQPPHCTFWSPSIGTSGINAIGDIVGSRSGCGDADGGPYAWYGQPPIVNLQPFMPPGMTGHPLGINAARTIVGYMGQIGGSGSSKAFAYSNGIVTELLRLPGHNTATAHQINENDIACGFSQNNITGPMKAVIWEGMSPVVTARAELERACDLAKWIRMWLDGRRH